MKQMNIQITVERVTLCLTCLSPHPPTGQDVEQETQRSWTSTGTPLTSP